MKRPLSTIEAKALIEAHEIGAQELGKNGRPAGVFNYSFRQLLQKTRILREAQFSSVEIRLLMEKKIVGEITNEQIQTAIKAENLAPSLEVSIRESGSIDQYTTLDTPDMVGKKILVNFIQDRYQPGSNASLYPVPQLVLTKEFLDPASRDLAATIQRESMNANQKFQEVGGWMIFTDQGAYRSDTFTSNDPYIIENGPVLKGLEQVLERARQVEGFGVKIIDIEFFHTHFERGEAFSYGDLDFQERYYQKPSTCKICDDKIRVEARLN